MIVILWALMELVVWRSGSLIAYLHLAGIDVNET